jgi:hypothetical protein
MTAAAMAIEATLMGVSDVGAGFRSMHQPLVVGQAL